MNNDDTQMPYILTYVAALHVFSLIFLNENCHILTKISLKLVLKGPILKII